MADGIIRKDDDGFENGDAFLRSDSLQSSVAVEDADGTLTACDDVAESQRTNDSECRRTLLVPSVAYLESGYKTNIDRLEVRTYLIE